MKTNLLSIILAVVFLTGCNKTSTKIEPLFLNQAQLHSLGIEVSEKGVFYKNTNPNWKNDNEKYCTLAFYLTNDNYVTTLHLEEDDTLTVKTDIDSLLKLQTTTKNDFYPLLIGDTQGRMSLNQDFPADMKLLPVAICMADTKLPNRTDTVLVWFKPTESLKKTLLESVDIDKHIQLIPKLKK